MIYLDNHSTAEQPNRYVYSKAALCLLIAIIIVLSNIVVKNSEAAEKNVASIYIDRKARIMYAFDDHGRVMRKVPCGIGRGGIKEKKIISDHVTPTGRFKVDIIMYKNDKYAAIDDSVKKKYSKGEYSSFFSSKQGLVKLFDNMNSLDFDNDAKADYAYGIGYLGLDSDKAVTGPKMNKFSGTAYWYSIAIHGTPNESNVGKAESGGCIHLRETDLIWLIENGIISLGTSVLIFDEPPSIKSPKELLLRSIRKRFWS